jgi:hypothetical protein
MKISDPVADMVRMAGNPAAGWLPVRDNDVPDASLA